MGVTEAEFWRMTLREYGALLAQATTRERRENARTARLMALLCEVLAPRKDGQHYKPSDFMPDETPHREAPRQQQPMAWQDMKRACLMMNTALGGTTTAATPREEG